MPSNVICPNPSCGKSYQVATEYLGRRGRCKSCGTEFVFSLSDASLESAPASKGETPQESTGGASGTRSGGSAPTRVGRNSIPASLGRFQILERVGIGGFGAVYRALDPQLQRPIALKLLQSTGDEKRDQHRIDRFLIEGRAGARLQHPNIVPVFDAGRDEQSGEYYMAAAFISGGSLASAIDGTPLELRRAAILVKQIALALDYAHGQGILHRDIKPDNVMLDEEGEPHLMDFGLARIEESEADLTRDGAVMGTPSYMSPEQCLGKQSVLGPATDQYSLGCLLFELLTGEKLFSGPVSVQIHHQIHTEAPAPSTKNPAIPKDLDTICLKTLSKEPERRYASCAELAADLQRWLTDEPIQARRLTNWERWKRWRRRNPAIAALSAGLATTLVIGLLGVTTQWIRAEEHARLARLATVEESKAKTLAQDAEGRAIKDRELAKQAADANKKIAYSAHMNLGQQAWNESDIAFLQDLLTRYLPTRDSEDLRCYEWYYWWRMSHGYLRKINVGGRLVTNVAFSADGKTLATGSIDRQLRLWNVDTGQLLATLTGHSNQIYSLKFSPDGKLLASGGKDGKTILWDVQTAQQFKTHQGDSGTVMGIGFAPDGKTLVMASTKIVRWNFDSGEAQATATGLFNGYGEHWKGTLVGISPDCSQVGVGSDSGIIIWDATSGQKISTLRGHTDQVSSVAFSADGKTLVSGSWDRTVKLWDIATGKEKSTLRGHTNHVFDVAFSADSTVIASAGRDLTVRLWDATTGQPLTTFKGHSGAIATLAFSPVGNKLASGGRDYSVALWDTSIRQNQSDILKHDTRILAVAFAPDSRTFASGGGFSNGSDGTSVVRLWDVATATEQRKFEQPGSCKVLAFSPDGKTLATGSTDNNVRLWDLASGELKRTIPAPCNPGLTFLIRCLSYSPDGTLLATNGEARGSINVWNTSTGKLQNTLAAEGQDSTSTAFSPDGKLLAAGSLDLAVRVWDVTTGKQVQKLQGHTETVWIAAFSKDGKTLVSAGKDSTVKFWDVATGKLRTSLTGHTDTVTWLAFTADGKTLATTSGDTSVKLWDITTGDLKSTLTGHSDYNYSVAFAPDGKTLASCSLDRTVRLWRAATDAEIQAGSK